MSIHALFDALFEEERMEFEREKEKDEGGEEEKRGTKAYLHFESANLQVSQTTALTSVTQRAATKPTVEAIADILENICSCSRSKKVKRGGDEKLAARKSTKKSRTYTGLTIKTKLHNKNQKEKILLEGRVL